MLDRVKNVCFELTNFTHSSSQRRVNGLRELLLLFNDRFCEKRKKLRRVLIH